MLVGVVVLAGVDYNADLLCWPAVRYQLESAVVQVSRYGKTRHGSKLQTSHLEAGD